jgi:hypothetical protein
VTKAKTKPKKQIDSHAHTTGRHHIDRRATQIMALPEGQGNPDDILTTQQVADWLGCSVVWLEIGRHRGYGPKFMKFAANMVRYRRDAVRDWLESRGEFSSTDEYKARAKVKVA